jgi:general secretion pathway protein K
VDELKLVLGMTPELFRRVEPVLTVYSGKPTIDPHVASQLARQAMAGGDLRNVPAANIGATPSGPDAGMIAPSFSLNGRAFQIRIEFQSGKTRVLREAVVRLTGDPSSPYWLLSWRTPP